MIFKTHLVKNFYAGFNNVILEQLSFQALEQINQTVDTLSFKLPHNLSPNIIKIVPCLTISTTKPYCYYISLDIEGESINLTSIGEKKSLQHQSTSSILEIQAEIDTFNLTKPLNSIILTLHSPNLSLLNDNPWLFTVSCQLKEEKEIDVNEKHDVINNSINLIVPTKSQKHVPTIGHRICSPTCVSMLLDYFGNHTTPEEIANLAYHPIEKLYGVWPMNLYAASHFNTLGTLVFFSDLTSALKLLYRNIPIITSIRYAQNELTNAAEIRHSKNPSGHLILLKGFEDKYIIANDPAAMTLKTVERRYLKDEFLPIWLKRSAIAYVIFPV